MINEIIISLFSIMWYVSIILVLILFVSGLDDLFFDILYWRYYFYRLQKTKQYQPLNYECLLDNKEQKIAVLIPCWQEGRAISAMLKHNSYTIDYKNYYFFVGVYANDHKTLKEVKVAARLNKRILITVNKKPGPTSKADNLNQIYVSIKEYEKKIQSPFDIVVFHNATDVIHPLSFRLYNHLIPRKDSVQIPLFPVKVNYNNFTHWLYADELSEAYTKDSVVREVIGAHTSSFIAGTAFSRPALKNLEISDQGHLFFPEAANPYSISLAAKLNNLEQILVIQFAKRLKWQHRWFFRKQYKQHLIYEYIATQALFPTNYKQAVQQKSCRIKEIISQKRPNSRTLQSWGLRYTLLHDKKIAITYFVHGLAYAAGLYWLMYLLLTWQNANFPSLLQQLNQHPLIAWMSIFVLLMLLGRLVQRVIAIKRVYHYWLPAFLTIPRAFYNPIVNFHAISAVYFGYFTKRVPANKVPHAFPNNHILVPYQRKLGQLLLQNKLITEEQLKLAIIKQQKTGERLGVILRRLNLINNQQLLLFLAKQYRLSLFPTSEANQAKRNCLMHLPENMVNGLVEHQAIPVGIQLDNKVITLGIYDPTNEPQIHHIINYIAPYKAEFVLLDDEN